MRELFAVGICLILSLTTGQAQAAHSVSITAYGWTVIADTAQSTLMIAHNRLGTILEHVRLNLTNGSEVRQLKNWTVEKKLQDQLSLRTSTPRTAWLIKLRPNSLEISDTSGEAFLTSIAPASAERIVARLIDPEGIPVIWAGTHEVADTYGGKQTRNPSFLPRRNPEVMYFGLGQISSLNFHSLFDRKADTAIQFSDQTRMRRDPRDPNVLAVTIPVPVNTMVRLFPNYFTKTLGVPYYVPFDDSHFLTAPVVWNSWDNYYSEVTEKDIVQNADWIAKNLKAYGFRYVVLDDGYDRGKNGSHDWIGKWDKQKFPHGPQWLASYIKSKGLLPGVWLVPNSYAGAVKQHPDWYLKYQNGKMVMDYNTPALDSTNPQVLGFLEREFKILDGWGFEYFKFDGEYAIPQYVPGVDKSRLYNQSINPLAAYRNRLKLIRQMIGPGRFIEGCPAGTPLNGIGYFDSYFNGDDMYASWQGSYPLFSSINANAFLNHIVVYVMPGEGIDLAPVATVAEEAKRTRSHASSTVQSKESPMEKEAKRNGPGVIETVRQRELPMMGFGTTMAEARTLVTSLGLTGVVYPVSSIMPELPAARVRLLKMTMPPLPIFPIDLFSRGTTMRYDLFRHTTAEDYIQNYPRVLDLKVNAASGVYDVVGMTDWRSTAVTREVSFRNQLGLKPNSSYIAFDFWSQKLYGVFKNRMRVDIQPHDTRVFLVHTLLNRPQLIGTSRHITGAYSVQHLGWDAPDRILSGASRTVPGEEYALSVYVPDGWSVSHAKVRAGTDQKVEAHLERTGNLLKVSFQGQPQPVDWKITFRTGAPK